MSSCCPIGVIDAWYKNDLRWSSQPEQQGLDGPAVRFLGVSYANRAGCGWQRDSLTGIQGWLAAGRQPFSAARQASRRGAPDASVELHHAVEQAEEREMRHRCGGAAARVRSGQHTAEQRPPSPAAGRGAAMGPTLNMGFASTLRLGFAQPVVTRRESEAGTRSAPGCPASDARELGCVAGC